MRAYVIIVALLCSFIFGAASAQTGFTFSTVTPFILSLSVVAYAGLTSRQTRSGPMSFDRLTHF